MSTLDMTKELIHEWAMNHKNRVIEHWFDDSSIDYSLTTSDVFEAYVQANNVKFTYNASDTEEANLYVENEARLQGLDASDPGVHMKLLNEFIEREIAEKENYPDPMKGPNYVLEYHIFNDVGTWNAYDSCQLTDMITDPLIEEMKNEDPGSPESDAYFRGYVDLVRAGATDDDMREATSTGNFKCAFDEDDLYDWAIDAHAVMKEALENKGFYRVPAVTIFNNDNLRQEAVEVMQDALSTVPLPPVQYTIYGVTTQDFAQALHLIEFGDE